MRSNQKGFTLIELLAVIVILAIIALIATPIILNIVSKARKSAAMDSIYGTMKAIELTYAESILNGEDMIDLPFTVNCDGNECTYGTDGSGKVIFSGTVPNGNFTLNDDGKFDEATGVKVNTVTCDLSKATQKVTCP